MQAAGCDRIFTDTISGGKAERPRLTDAPAYARASDTLVVWRLDRLGRSLSNLIELMTQLDDRGVGFKSLTEQIDTTTSSGKLIFHIFGALAELERNLIRERTMAGLTAARARGRFGGRPKVLDSPTNVAMAQSLYNDKSNSIADICRTLGLSRSTLFPSRRSSPPTTSTATLSNQGRTAMWSIHEDALDRVRARHETAAYEKAMDKRKVWVEPIFAEAKQRHNLDTFRLRRLPKVNTEALLTASDQNLKRWLAATGWGRGQFPGSALAAVSLSY